MSLVRGLALALGGAGAVALAAQVSLTVPGSPVPVSLQTFAVLGLPFVAGVPWAAAGLGLYLGLAALGAPVLAGGAGGMAALSGPTAGYLAGFLLALPVSFGLAEGLRGWPRLLGVALGAAAGHLVILAAGVAWLVVGRGVSSQGAIDQGALPFLLGGALKSLAVGAAVASGERLAWGRGKGGGRGLSGGRSG